jgi:DNA/RNA endonuclease YhcR with UshA esterase domain
LGAWVVCGLLLAAVPAVAHHAVAAQYDMDKPVEITGALKKMEFINPHSMLHLEVTNQDGTKTVWIFQTTNAGTLRQRGLARSGPGSLEPGATYTVKGFAARNGNPMGFLRTLVFPDRREITFWFGDPNGL